jgi:transposase
MLTLVAPAPSDLFGARFAAPRWADDDPRCLDLETRLASDHLARRLEQAVARLDLAALFASYAGTGSPAHRPDLMLRAVLYETQRGHHSPAAWYRDARESEPLRWLLRGSTPARSCWYAFRDRIAPLLPEFHRQVLQQALAGGQTTAQRGALDGTLVAAQASRHKLVNAATLDKRLTQLAQAVAADAPGQTPPTVPGWMAKRSATRRRQLERLRQAQTQLAARQAYNQAKRASKRKATEKIVISLSDPEAAVGRDKEGVYRPLYNVQIVDDLDTPFVLAYDVFAQPNDAGVLGRVLAQLRAGLGRQVEILLADTAYAGGSDLAAAQAAGVVLYAPLPKAADSPKQIPKEAFAWQAAEQTYVCPQGHRLVYDGAARQKRSSPEAVVLHRYRCPPVHGRACPLRARCTPNPQAGRTIGRSEHEEVVVALRERMQTVAAKALYRLRCQTVELVNADWKEHRRLRRFHGRGLARARGQIGLMVLAHNLLTLLTEESKAEQSKATGPAPNTVTSDEIAI